MDTLRRLLLGPRQGGQGLDRVFDSGNLVGHAMHHGERTRDSQGKIRCRQYVTNRFC